MQKWQQATKWESEWWGDCVNSFGEESKQLVYAQKMGLEAKMVLGKYPVYDMEGKTIVDIGGGPVSMLLKCTGMAGAVVDPCEYPPWIKQRYEIKNILYTQLKAENLIPMFLPYWYAVTDEVWIYNVLQHTDNPQKIIENAKNISKIIRIFEWIETGTNEGHIHNLTEANLNKWLGGVGKVEQLDQNFCHGLCYYGIFKGKHYDK